jgi:hypothetical protein
MLKRYLIVISVNKGSWNEEEVATYETERSVIQEVGRIAAGPQNGFEDTRKLEKVYEVDLDRGTIKQLEPALENMQIVLKEKK